MNFASKRGVLVCRSLQPETVRGNLRGTMRRPHSQGIWRALLLLAALAGILAGSEAAVGGAIPGEHAPTLYLAADFQIFQSESTKYQQSIKIQNTPEVSK